jgi:4-amino-4-deoxy-L-arabinose transferase-like glycosyltransferase
VTPSRFDLLVNAAGVAAILMLAALSAPAPVYDEPHRLEVVEVLREHGFTIEFLRQMPHATGPLTPLVQQALSPVTGLRPPGIRLTNAGLIGLVMVLTALTLRRRGSTAPWHHAIALASVPTTWVLAGLSLTEAPAMVCLAMAVLALAGLSVRASHHDVIRRALIAGVGTGLAALGRQPFLLAAAILPLAASTPRQRLSLVLAAAVGLLPVAAVFLVWGGPTPPSVAEVGAGFAPRHFALALAYAGVFTLIYAPGWLRRSAGIAWLVAGAALLNAVSGFVTVLPMASVLETAIAPALLDVARTLLGTAFVALGVWFGASLLARAREAGEDRFTVFLSVGLFLVLASTIKITGNFSSRYVAMTAPLLLPLLAPARHVDSPWTPWRSLAGNALGAATLLSYLYG